MASHINETQAVTQLQRYLRRLSYEGLGGARVPIDGIFGTATKEALSEFQRENGLAVTGTADKATWDALFADYTRVTENERNSAGLYFFPTDRQDFSVSAGDSFMLVNIIQLLLSELRITYDIFEDVTESGTYDGNTEAAIREFQRINGLAPSGEVDAATWNRIVREYSNLERRE